MKTLARITFALAITSAILGIWAPIGAQWQWAVAFVLLLFVAAALAAQMRKAGRGGALPPAAPGAPPEEIGDEELETVEPTSAIDMLEIELAEATYRDASYAARVARVRASKLEGKLAVARTSGGDEALINALATEAARSHDLMNQELERARRAFDTVKHLRSGEEAGR